MTDYKDWRGQRFCIVCSKTIHTMCHKNTDYCSQLCENEKRKIDALKDIEPETDWMDI